MELFDRVMEKRCNGLFVRWKEGERRAVQYAQAFYVKLDFAVQRWARHHTDIIAKARTHFPPRANRVQCAKKYSQSVTTILRTKKSYATERGGTSLTNTEGEMVWLSYVEYNDGCDEK